MVKFAPRARRLRAWTVLCLLASVLIALPATSASAATSVFINEIHYDNTGTDVGEAIEVAGPAGTDLTGWSLVLYNGNGGAVYSTTVLSGLIPDQGAGFGTVVTTYPSNGIQNGSPDGVALVDASNAVVQFLSYEGTFTAVGGAAGGMPSVDIGVSESGSDPVGESLQLTGTGSMYEDFTWAGSQPNTFGAANTGQTFTGTPLPPVVVINEIDYDQAGTDVAEFVELKNAGSSSADLTGWSVELVNGTGGGAAVYDTISLTGLTLAAGDYLVICANAATVANCDLDDGPDTNFIQNGAPDAVGLRDGGGVLVDAVSYEGDTGAPYTEGSGSGLEDDPSIDDSGIARCDDGVDTNQNNIDLVFTAITPGAANACTVPGPSVVINEIDYDQDGTDTAEFFELKNNGTDAVDLTGWTVELVNGNGGGAVIYDTIALPAVTLAAGDYFVVCANAATVANCDLDDGPDTNFIQNGAPDAVGLRDAAGDLADAVSYEGDTGAPYTEGSGTGLVDDPGVSISGISRFPDGTDTDVNNVDLSARCITPGTSNSGDTTGCTGPVVCDTVPLPISTIQGTTDVTPCSGQAVTIEGVVVGDYEGPSPELRGFYVQEEDADHDGDPLTSEGIFVFNFDNDNVALGDLVSVTGTASEFQGQTQISSVSNISVLASNQTVTPASASLPVAASDEFERFEGMLVTFNQTLYVTEFFQLGRFGQVVVSSGDRLVQPTSIVDPGAAAIALQGANNLNRLIVDDDLQNQNPDPILFGGGGNPLTAANPLRGGDTLTDVVGVMTYTWAGNSASGNAYRLRPVGDLSDSGLVPGGVVPVFNSANPRPAAPPGVGGSLEVVSFNVLNYFLTIDTGGTPCGPIGFPQGCRGADSADELSRQRTKLLAALEKLDADVLGLIELENTEGVEPLADIVAGLNASMGTGTYSYVDTGTIGTDVIKVGLIYKPGSVTPLGAHAILDSSVDPTFDDTLNRPVLAQSFVDNGSGEVMTVAVNHLKSKGCTDATGAEADMGDGAGCWNPARTAAAAAEVAWLASGPTGVSDPDVLVIGDLNSYAMEDPIDVFVGAGYANLISDFGGADAYSFVFDGQWGYLDYALASSSMAAQVTGTAEYHINADEPSVLDYNTEFQSAGQIVSLYAPDEFRTSDHDPVIVGLDLDAVGGVASASPDELWPPNHKYVTVEVSAVGSGGETLSVEIVEVTSSEADVVVPGDKPNDIVVLGPSTLDLRAQRYSQDGRTYTITALVTSGAGQVQLVTTAVVVPFSQGT